MPLLADLTAAVVAGLLALVVVRWYVQSPAMPERPTDEVARAAGEAVRKHARLRRFVARRLDRSVATGLLLTVALTMTLVGGLVLGILAVLVRRVAAIQHVDNSVAAWGYDHRGSASSNGLRAITDLGNIRIVLVAAAVLVLVEAIRHRNGWPLLFLLAVLAGMEAAMLGVKELVGRLRPTLDPAASTLGPSFPSGHSATAAAFYAAAALVIGRSLRRPLRQFVIAAAVAIAVAVAASRVLLDLHWLSDVIGGLSLGWAWFALCAVIFGGRLLRPTATAELVSAQAAGKTARHQRLERKQKPGSSLHVWSNRRTGKTGGLGRPEFHSHAAEVVISHKEANVSILLLVALLLLLFAIVGGVAISKFLFLILIVAIVIAAIGFFSRRTA